MTNSRAYALEATGIERRFALPQDKLFAPKRFLHAVDGIDVRVREGETLGVVGESGCGKSTLGRVLIGLDKADAGTIAWGGSPAAAHTGAVQAVFQDPSSALNPRRSVGDSIAEALPKLSQRARNDRVAELMGLVDLDEQLMHRYPHELSGGQQQRVCIARAIASDPTLILLDEAVSSLDASLQMQVIELLRELQERTGAAFIFISHDLRAVRGVSDWIAVMYLGQIVELAPADEFDDQLRHPYSVALRSAEPSIPGDPFVAERIILEGDPPSAVDLPVGCRFASRCPVAQKRCFEEAPPLESDDAGRAIRCHFPGSLQLTRRHEKESQQP
ncbi:oligopeptide/dipeptide ABC transporter ATP-binding protein [Leucobacter chinensis]|uniref:oligopeptide/dipeptide ABC transporter ATP-binding protein n=1 Tax=Leucobacter chinensis TaxID=2851010 RepID=UPI001C245587|nr:ABC transporter ATP-binding protein [Leucobacter chinensis]